MKGMMPHGITGLERVKVTFSCVSVDLHQNTYFGTVCSFPYETLSSRRKTFLGMAPK
jgi:hypothetical protein